MKNLAFSFDKYLKNKKVLNKTCEIHKDTNLVQFNNHKPFCEKCLKVRKNEKQKNMENTIKKRKNTDILEKRSILNDETIKLSSFDNFETTTKGQSESKKRALSIAKGYCKLENKGNTVFVGKAGTGKSHLAYSILKYVNENAEQPQSCLFIDVNDLLRKIKNSFQDKKTGYESKMIDFISNVDLLVLDDLGSESTFQKESNSSSDFNQQELFKILNQRDRTIITTNLNSTELQKVYNYKLVSRMFKSSKNKTLSFDNIEDYRINH